MNAKNLSSDAGSPLRPIAYLVTTFVKLSLIGLSLTAPVLTRSALADTRPVPVRLKLDGGEFTAYRQGADIWLVPDFIPVSLRRSEAFAQPDCASYDEKILQLKAGLEKCDTAPTSSFCKASILQLDMARYEPTANLAGVYQSWSVAGPSSAQTAFEYQPTPSDLKMISQKMAGAVDTVIARLRIVDGKPSPDIVTMTSSANRRVSYLLSRGVVPTDPGKFDPESQTFSTRGVEVACDLIEGGQLQWGQGITLAADLERVIDAKTLWSVYESIQAAGDIKASDAMQRAAIAGARVYRTLIAQGVDADVAQSEKALQFVFNALYEIDAAAKDFRPRSYADLTELREKHYQRRIELMSATIAGKAL